MKQIGRHPKGKIPYSDLTVLSIALYAWSKHSNVFLPEKGHVLLSTTSAHFQASSIIRIWTCASNILSPPIVIIPQFYSKMLC